MGAANRVQPLAGLVSPAAEKLYSRLRAVGSTQVGTAVDEMDSQAEATAELLDLGLAVRTAGRDTLIRPIDQSSALRLLIERRQHELVTAQQRILDAWTSLTSLVWHENVADRHSVDGVLSLPSHQEVAARAALLYPAAKKRMRATTREFATWPVKGSAQPVAGRGGTRIQTICHLHCLSTPTGSRMVEESTRRGEEVRLRTDVPVQLLHVDDTIALICTDRAAQSALLVRRPAFITMLGEWFDLLWEHPATVTANQKCDDILSAGQRRVLELMMSNGDEAIARRLTMSISTVRRHVKAIYLALGVDNRFAAGVAAAKRGWI